MSKKIYTKSFHVTINASASTPPVETKLEPSAFWLMEDDIDVIGAEIQVESATPSENDGIANAYAELSQVGLLHAHGMILCASASEWWNTAPAGIARTNGHAVVAFPSGMAIPVREEGYIYINTSALGKTAGLSVFEAQVIVYYTKKGAR